MDMLCEQVSNVMLVTLTGSQLDAGTTTAFKRAISPVLEAHRHVVFDLSRLEFIDSSGLGALLSCLRQIQTKGGDLKLCGMSKQVRTLFELVRMHRLFHIFDSSMAAIQAFQA
jgi:anti-sigma B factor antagonist